MKAILLLLILTIQTGVCQEVSNSKIDRIKLILTDIEAKQRELGKELADIKCTTDPVANLSALEHIYCELGHSPRDQIRGTIGFIILDNPQIVYELNKESIENLNTIIQSEISISPPVVSGILIDSFVHVQDPKTFTYITPERFRYVLNGAYLARHGEMFTNSIQKMETGMKAAEFIRIDLLK